MPSGVRTFGIDVSHWNGKISWDKALAPTAPAKIHFCYVKATQLFTNAHGNPVRQKDSEYDENWTALMASTVRHGAYHYCNPEFDPGDMADLFFTVYKPRKGDLLPAIDIEDEYVTAIQNGSRTRKQLVAQILDFGKIIQDKIGARPFIYIRKDITDFLGNPPEFADFPLWIANYQHPPSPPVPKPWPFYTLWQYAENGKVTGVPGDCDLNYLNGPPDLLDKFVI